MKLYLSNTLTSSKEEFTPIDKNNIRMYVCGPTVYDRPHLGNARSAVVYDILFRTLSALYPKVTYARNITDIDDKIINAANDKKLSILAITQKYTKYFHDDILAIGCLNPTHEPKATAHINDMIDMISALLENGNAYESAGHVMFDVGSLKSYGKLSKRNKDDLIAGASERLDDASYKQNPNDFVLWKPVKGAKAGEGFDSPWGVGRPGWHIECSAMSKNLLGDIFDIHGGGADLKFPHHENELAQSCAANKTDKMANYWVHNGFLTVEGEKMSKSLNNFTTVRDLLDTGVDGAVIRLLYLTTHYRKPLDFSKKSLADAQKAYDKFANVLNDLPASYEPSYDNEALGFLADDLNTPKVLALAHKLAASSNSARLADILQTIGVNCKADQKGVVMPEYIIKLAEQRKNARAKQDWQQSDKLRDEIEKAGYQIKDIAGNRYEIL